MTTFALRLLRRLSPNLGAACGVGQIFFQKLGWWKSRLAQRPMDSQGRPLPWLTYPALAWLDQLDLSRCRIFEYGAGWGTLHWAQRARAVSAVEIREDWVRELRPQLPAHVTLHGPLEGAEYTQCARQNAPWDVVIVDGADRLECAKAAVEVLRPGGFILLDNADWFTEAADFLRSRGLIQIDFQGFGPSNAYTWTTSVFLTPEFNIPRLASSWSGTDRGSIPYQP